MIFYLELKIREISTRNIIYVYVYTYINQDDE